MFVLGVGLVPFLSLQCPSEWNSRFEGFDVSSNVLGSSGVYVYFMGLKEGCF